MGRRMGRGTQTGRRGAGSWSQGCFLRTLDTRLPHSWLFWRLRAPSFWPSPTRGVRQGLGLSWLFGGPCRERLEI